MNDINFLQVVKDELECCNKKDEAKAVMTTGSTFSGSGMCHSNCCCCCHRCPCCGRPYQQWQRYQPNWYYCGDQNSNYSVVQGNTLNGLTALN